MRCCFGECAARARYEPRTPSPDSTQVYCLQHRPPSPGYQKIGERYCIVARCGSRAIFGPPSGCVRRPGTGASAGIVSTHCREHRPDGYRNAVYKQCIAAECSKRPSYGPPGAETTDATHCLTHRLSGYLPIIFNARCLADGCRTRASFGLPGKRSAYCNRHRPAGYRCDRPQRCAHLGCATTPYFGPPGGSPVDARHCRRHCSAGYVNIKSKTCEVPGCLKRATYIPPAPGGVMRFKAERPSATRCTSHKLAGYTSPNNTRRRKN